MPAVTTCHYACAARGSQHMHPTTRKHANFMENKFICIDQDHLHAAWTSLQDAGQDNAMHYEIWKYCQSTAKVHA